MESAKATSSAVPVGDWIECYSEKQQKSYFYNTVTHESVWERPTPPSAGVPTPETPNQSTNKRKRDGDDSYQPPVSGSAADESAMSTRVLPPPVIVEALPTSSESMWTRKDIQVNDYLASVYVEGKIVDKHGVLQKFKDITNPYQGRHLYNLIRDNKFTVTLEVGLAMGASAAWISQAHADNGLNGSHIAVDPNQTSQYDGMGRTMVERCGLAACLSVMEMTSYRALPILLEEIIQRKRPKFHLIYIDGWHTFDYTLVDFFYADLILDVHGVIVLDDIRHKPVQKFLKYVRTNCPNYSIVPKTPCYIEGMPQESTQATMIKLANDTREWNYHKDF